MAWMSDFTLTMRASSGLSMILGTMTAARMPRMTTTTITSMRVKPDCVLRVCMAVLAGKMWVKARPARMPIIHQGPDVPHASQSLRPGAPIAAAALAAALGARALPAARRPGRPCAVAVALRPGPHRARRAVALVHRQLRAPRDGPSAGGHGRAGAALAAVRGCAGRLAHAGGGECRRIGGGPGAAHRRLAGGLVRGHLR